ncbi:hypothetical protein QNM97_06240 [Gordonia sp. L191]|uniref:PPE domain-containing protein n=1 Tax=Gordonia sp. L191 TaxID=2982699 RepID=UPI0024C092C7|nr:hypothetical protein [Gordonia sp. L191]WHU48594.1 hypothetical protein QNM97_06240 [Gordonia sp. L191]
MGEETRTSISVPSVPTAVRNTLDTLISLQNATQRKPGTDTQSLAVNHENWDSKTFLQMRDVKDSLNAGTVRAVAAGWKTLGSEWADAMESYKKNIADVTSGDWTGDAASAANGAVSSFVGEFPQSIREFGGSLSDRLTHLAENFDLVVSNFPETPESRYQHHEFNNESMAEVRNYYSYDEVVTENTYTGGYTWKFADMDGDENSPFDDLKKILDDSYAAATKAKELLTTNYSQALDAVLQNMPTMAPASGNPTGGFDSGPMGGGAGGAGGGGGGGAGGGGGGAPHPDVSKAVNRALDDIKRQQVTPASGSENPMQQVANTAGQALSSLGSQAAQGVQQALSQAEQTAQQAVQQAAQQVSATAPTGEASGFSGMVSPAALRSGAGGGGAGKGGGGAGKGAGGGGGAPGGGTPEKPTERTTKAGTTSSEQTTTARPAAGIAQTSQGTGTSGAGAPGAGGRGAGGGGDKVHKVLKALRTRVNGEAIVGVAKDDAAPVTTGDNGENPGPDGGVRA